MTPTTKAKLTRYFILAWYAHLTGHEDAAVTYQSWWEAILCSPLHSAPTNGVWQ